MVVLGAMIAASTVTRAAVAWHHSVPRYFPDEYVYASLGRSIAHGHLQVNGVTALFPALVSPALTAPLWAAFPLNTAYHLIQAENALFASLAAIPVYLLARRLGLSAGFSLLCALYTLLTPTLVMVALNLTDFAAYPLVLTAILFGQRSLENPTRANQLLFLGLAGLTTLTRTEYFVLVPAYAVAAFALDRRRALRRHLLAFAAVIPGAVAIVVALTGYFRGGAHHLLIGPTALGQIALQAFLLTLVAGVVIVPGAVVGLWRPSDRRTAAFAWMAAAFTAFLLVEIGAFSVTTDAKFRERYLFAIAPLLAIAFGIYLKRRCPHRWSVFILSVALAIAAARVPVSSYSTGAARFDSQTLIAIEWLQDRTIAASASLVVAGIFTIGALWATAGALRARILTLALPAAVALTATFTVVATHQDLRATSTVRHDLPADPVWVSRAAKGSFTAIGTPLSSATSLLELLYWNPDVRRYLVLDDADIPVPYAGPEVLPGHDGGLRGASGYFLFDANGTQATFANARLLKSRMNYQLWHSRSTPRLRTLVEGIWANGWLIAGGRIRAWPLKPSIASEVHLTFDLGVPANWPGYSTLSLNGKRVKLLPGKRAHIVCTGRGIVNVRYLSQSTVFDQNNTPISVELTHLRARDSAPRAGSKGSTSCRKV